MLLLLVPIGILFINLLLQNCFVSEDKRRKSIMFFSFVFVVLFVGLRSRYIGSADTRIYASMFERAHGQGLLTFLAGNDICPQNFIYSEGSFFLISWILAQVFENAQAFLLISSAVITYSVATFIWKNSKSDTLSWILYSCLGLMTFSMNGMRQAIAMSICLLSFEFVKQKNFLKFFLIIFIAFTFHRTAIVFLLVYLIYNYKPSAFANILVGVSSTAFLLNSRKLAEIYDQFTKEDYASGAEIESGGIISVLIYSIVIVLSLVYLSFSEKENKKIVITLSLLSFVGMLFYVSRYFSTQVYERISYYFFYFVIILFPELKFLFDERTRILYKLIVALMAIMLFAYRLNNGSFANYTFFIWE